LKSADFHSAPGNIFDHARTLIRNRHNIADLKRLVGLHCETGKQISQSILQRQTDDDADNRRTGKYRGEFFVCALILRLKNNKKGNQANDDCKNSSNQS
jgi:hypothetical protein